MVTSYNLNMNLKSFVCAKAAAVQVKHLLNQCRSVCAQLQEFEFVTQFSHLFCTERPYLDYSIKACCAVGQRSRHLSLPATGTANQLLTTLSHAMCSTCGIVKSPPLAPWRYVMHWSFVTQSLLQPGWESAVIPAVAALWQGAELWRAHHALAQAERSRHPVSSLSLHPVWALLNELIGSASGVTRGASRQQPAASLHMHRALH